MTTANPDIYYDGDLGDICNVDWFFAQNNDELNDVTSVVLCTVPGIGLSVDITYQQGCRIANSRIVKNPKLQTNGTIPRSGPKFYTIDIGRRVYVDNGKANRDPGELVTIAGRPGGDLLEVRMDQDGLIYPFDDKIVHRMRVDPLVTAPPQFTAADVGSLVWIDMEPGAPREPAFLSEIGSLTHRVILKNGGLTWTAGDVYRTAIASVHRHAIGTPTPVKQSGGYHTYPRSDFIKPKGKPGRSEHDRLKDFFRGKDTW